MVKKITQELVIGKFRIVHGDKYDYSNVKYLKSSIKIEVVCKDHGPFLIKTGDHYRGRGCPKCGRLKIKESLTLSQKDVINEFKEVHGNKYDYTKVNYQKSDIKVEILCLKHGPFFQTPSHHRLGQGCPQCGHTTRGLSGRSSETDVLKRFKKVHGDKYDYSKVKYVTSNTHVTIICKEHGEISMKPSNHLNGKGCRLCFIVEDSKRKLEKGKNSFLKKFIKTHGNRYDYSLVNYVSSTIPVKIICKIHGVFEQTPIGHHTGSGCTKCGVDERTEGLKIPLKQLVREFRDSHGDKYDYSKVKYKSSLTNVRIGCPEHGEFLQTPSSHKNGQGCPVCGLYKRIESQTMDLDSVLNQFYLTHNDKYDYSRVEYVNARTKVKISCSEHGVFEQEPYSHIIGSGCPNCGEYGYKKNKLGYLYLHEVNIGDLRGIKFGITNKYGQRIKQLRSKIKDGILENICYYQGKGDIVFKTEKYIKSNFDTSYIQKQMMSDGYTETIEYSLDNLKKLLEVCGDKLEIIGD